MPRLGKRRWGPQTKSGKRVGCTEACEREREEGNGYWEGGEGTMGFRVVLYIRGVCTSRQ